MAMSLKFSRTKAYNPSTKEQGFRTSVKSNGKADMDSLILSASKNTTMHKGEIQLAFTLVLDAIKDALVEGKTVELKGIGTIGFSCSGAWTKTAEEQSTVSHKIGVAFYPSQEVHAAVATAKISWTKDGEGDEPTIPTAPDTSGGSTSGGDQKPPSKFEA